MLHIDAWSCLVLAHELAFLIPVKCGLWKTCNIVTVFSCRVCSFGPNTTWAHLGTAQLLAHSPLPIGMTMGLNPSGFAILNLKLRKIFELIKKSILVMGLEFCPNPNPSG